MNNINSNSTGVPLEQVSASHRAGDQALPGKARIFITGTIVMGLLALGLGFQHLETPHWPQYLSYLVLSVLVPPGRFGCRGLPEPCRRASCLS